MILRTVPVPGRDGDTLRDIYSDVHGDIPVARRVHHVVADEIVARCNAYEQLAEKLPCAYYMDPPDGGSVTIPEQLLRAMDDAEKYRSMLLTPTKLIVYERNHPISSRTIHASIARQWKAAGWVVTPDPDGA